MFSGDGNVCVQCSHMTKYVNRDHDFAQDKLRSIDNMITTNTTQLPKRALIKMKPNSPLASPISRTSINKIELSRHPHNCALKPILNHALIDLELKTCSPTNSSNI